MVEKKEEESSGRLSENETQKLSYSQFKPENIFEIKDRDPRFAYKALSVSRLESNGWQTGIWELMNTSNQSNEKMPAGFFSTDANSKLGGLRRVGGLVWARCPKEKAAARTAFYRKKSLIREELIKIKNDLRGVSSDVNLDYRKSDKVINIDI